MLKVGDKVKDFTLLDFNGKSHTLSNHLGKKVVVYFYPKDKTPGCTKQACDFRDNYHEIVNNMLFYLALVLIMLKVTKGLLINIIFHLLY